MATRRSVEWEPAARKAFDGFPDGAKARIAGALEQLRNGLMPSSVKPLHGLGSGVVEIAVRHDGDAYRTVCALQLAESLYVAHAFKKKSKKGIRTPREEIEIIRLRLRRFGSETDARARGKR